MSCPEQVVIPKREEPCRASGEEFDGCRRGSVVGVMRALPLRKDDTSVCRGLLS